MSRILITGITGFVGNNLSQELSKDYDITGVLRDRSIADVQRGSSIKYVGFDEINISLLNSSDIVIHLAGKAHDTKNTSDASVYFHVNFDLTKNLFVRFLESSASVFIYVSSVKAIADSVEGVLTEASAPNPGTPYGLSKLMAEQFLLKQELNGKRLYILRPCMIYGPGNKGNLNLLYQVIKRSIPYPFAAFHNKRSFLSVVNFIAVVRQLIENKTIPSGAYNLADDVAISTNELIAIMSKAMGKKLRLWKVPPRLVVFAGKTGDLLRLPFNSERLRKLTESYVVDNTAIKEAIGWSSMPIESSEGLFHTIKSFSIHG